MVVALDMLGNGVLVMVTRLGGDEAFTELGTPMPKREKRSLQHSVKRRRRGREERLARQIEDEVTSWQ